MKIQVLVATINQKDYSLLEKMRITTPAIVCNQCGKYEMVELDMEGGLVRWMSFDEKGVGLNRNNALMRATGDVCLFADDDMVYVDGYADIVGKAFEQIPDADVIVFNLIEQVPKRYVIKKTHRVNYFNYLRYGTARIAIRLASIRKNGIYFNQCFGGGAEYSRGEDNLFLTDCLKKGLHIYAVPTYIATLTEERPSTCDISSIEKVLHDKGVLFKQISRKYWKILCLQDAVRHSKSYGISTYKSYHLMSKI